MELIVVGQRKTIISLLDFGVNLHEFCIRLEQGNEVKPKTTIQ